VTLYEIIYETLKRNLHDATLPPGLVIGEAAVARTFGSSRAPAVSALQRLAEEGLLRRGPRRGFVVGANGLPLLRQDLMTAGLRLPDNLQGLMNDRGYRARLYPAVEREIAACLPYGRFQINETRLAQHYGVSRTIAHEFLVRLERLEIVRLDGARWYAGPLTIDRLHEHYEMRWLLEPVALVQSAPLLDRAQLRQAYERTLQYRARKGRPDVRRLQAIEQDLHGDIVMRCPNREMAATIYRSQLPLLATNDTFLPRLAAEPQRMISEHAEVLAQLLDGHTKAAAQSLERHLHSAFTDVSQRFQQLLSADFVPPAYMIKD
jgi:DNA-binding GntR family transcriptional regulator